MRPQLQHPGPQLQLGAQTKQPQLAPQWHPSGGMEAASNSMEQSKQEQFSELPPRHGSQYVRSAPPTPQQVAQRPLRAPRGKTSLSTIVGCLYVAWPIQSYTKRTFSRPFRVSFLFFTILIFSITSLHPVGFEPTTVNLEGCCSIHLKMHVHGCIVCVCVCMRVHVRIWPMAKCCSKAADVPLLSLHKCCLT